MSALPTPGAVATDALTGYALGRDITREDVWQIVRDSIEHDRAQRAEPEEEPVYWIHADDSQPHTLAFGADTAQIVDEEQGGAIAYCHFDNADEIVRALLAYRGRFA